MCLICMALVNLYTDTLFDFGIRTKLRCSRRMNRQPILQNHLGTRDGRSDWPQSIVKV